MSRIADRLCPVTRTWAPCATSCADPADGGVHHGGVARGEGEQERLSIHEAEGRREQAGVSGEAVGPEVRDLVDEPDHGVDGQLDRIELDQCGGAGVVLE